MSSQTYTADWAVIRLISTALAALSVGVCRRRLVALLGGTNWAWRTLANGDD